MITRKIAAVGLALGLAALATAGQIVTPLIAGQHILIGDVACSIGSSTAGACAFEVTTPGWCLTETHLYIGAALPSKAAPGLFPYQTSGGCLTRVIVPFSMTDVGVSSCPSGGSLVVMAHAVAVNQAQREQQTAWGYGSRTGLGGWSMSFALPCVVAGSV